MSLSQHNPTSYDKKRVPTNESVGTPFSASTPRTPTVEMPSRTVLTPSEKLMPAPFGWIEIPGKGYSIGKYPVTNAQFAKFIEAGGYKNKAWWTEEGWQKREEGWHYEDRKWKPSGTPWTEPHFWNNKEWNGAEQPVVGVSWFEAVAFCLWLSEATGENIMLPTESQWQYAAQGDDGRTYPWGNEWDSSRCQNSVDSKAGVTSPVTKYEGKGDSPFGVVDMAGNVWEWCLTDYENRSNDTNNSANSRVVRGGSWFNLYLVNFRCYSRDRYGPHTSYGYSGFRLSRS